MSTDDVQAIHQRLDRLDDKLNDLFGTLAQQVAVCSPSAQGAFDSRGGTSLA